MELEVKYDQASPSITPYFSLEFDALCQYYELLPWVSSSTTTLDPSVGLLAQRATAQLRPSKTTERLPSRLLNDLSSYVADDSQSPRHLAAFKEVFIPSVLEKVYAPLCSASTARPFSLT